jgi:hypothetical protein
MKHVFLGVVLMAFMQLVYAQADTASSYLNNHVTDNNEQVLQVISSGSKGKDDFSRGNIGIGMGIDYGGFGVRLTVLPAKPVFLFAGLGYNLAGIGYNIGAGLRLAPERRFCPYLLGMYGYNGVIVIKNDDQNTRSYYGPSIGAGFEVRSRSKKNYFNFELLLPFRPDSFNDDMDRLEKTGVEFSNKPLPVSFSFGYHFGW